MIWKNKIKGEDEIIAVRNNSIYKGRPKDFHKAIKELETDGVIPTELMGIPIRYIKELHFEARKNHIDILFGSDSSEQIIISDERLKKEIFDHLKSIIPNSKSTTEHYSKIRAGKKPLFAVAIFLPLFLWTLYIANEISLGAQYELVGGGGNSIAGIVLLLANLGTLKVILIFGAILMLSMVSFFYKTKHPKIVETIKVLKN